MIRTKAYPALPLLFACACVFLGCGDGETDDGTSAATASEADGGATGTSPSGDGTASDGGDGDSVTGDGDDGDGDGIGTDGGDGDSVAGDGDAGDGGDGDAGDGGDGDAGDGGDGDAGEAGSTGDGDGELFTYSVTGEGCYQWGNPAAVACAAADFAVFEGGKVDLSVGAQNLPYCTLGQDPFNIQMTYPDLDSVPSDYSGCDAATGGFGDPNSWGDYIEGASGLGGVGLIVRDLTNAHHYKVRIESNEIPNLVLRVEQID